MCYLCLQKWLKGFSWKKTPSPSFVPKRTYKTSSHGKISPSYATTTKNPTISGKYWASLYLYLYLSLSSRHLQLWDYDSCSTPACSPGGKAQHSHHGKNSRKSQTITELIKKKTKGHFTTSLPSCPSPLMGLVLPYTRRPHAEGRTWAMEGNLHLHLLWHAATG